MAARRRSEGAAHQDRAAWVQPAVAAVPLISSCAASRQCCAGPGERCTACGLVAVYKVACKAYMANSLFVLTLYQALPHLTATDEMLPHEHTVNWCVALYHAHLWNHHWRQCRTHAESIVLKIARRVLCDVVQQAQMQDRCHSASADCASADSRDAVVQSVGGTSTELHP
jgi:hypothetical protein